MTHLITLQQIRDERPRADGWTKLLSALGETHDAPDLTRQVSIGDVAQASGAADAIRCLRCIDDRGTRIRAIMPAVKRASVHATDQRVHDCIAAIDRRLGGAKSVDLRAVAKTAQLASEVERGPAAWAAAQAAAAAARAAAGAREWESGAADAAMRAAEWAAAREAAAEAAATESENQCRDLIDLFGLHALRS